MTECPSLRMAFPKAPVPLNVASKTLGSYKRADESSKASWLPISEIATFSGIGNVTALRAGALGNRRQGERAVRAVLRRGLAWTRVALATQSATLPSG